VTTTHAFWLAGRQATGESSFEVRHPWDDSLVGTVSVPTDAQVEEAVEAAVAALPVFAATPAHVRAAALDHVARRLTERTEEIARLITAENGKPIKWARGEVGRAASVFRWAAEEARRTNGETMRLDTDPGGVGRFAVVRKFPRGVVLGIAPFNFPLNLVAHKVAPAIAVGCPVVLKPATQTPLSSLLLAEMLTSVGLPPGWLNVIPGGGAEVGGALVVHPDVSYITFTGSPDVGWGIAARAPQKKVRLELGSNAPLIVDNDSDWQTAAAKTASAGFVQAGQSCVSTQRVFVHRDVAAGFREALVAGVARLKVGEPLGEDVDVSAVISNKDAVRIESWVNEAVAGGARTDIGGERTGNVVMPTVLSNVTRSMRVQADEIFGPVVTVTEFEDFDAALEAANDSRYGLNAGVYTNNIAKALRATRRLEFGSVYINDVPTVRADLQPYGGVKNSGNTREGPRYAMAEMTEPRLVTIQ
jgi:acyl-CoA reductase-like NAD-dependent aldehyde dehydrogenase